MTSEVAVKPAVLVATDLIFGSRVAQAAKALGVPLRTARDANALAAVLAGRPVALVMVDMSLDLGTATAAIRRARSQDPPPAVVAFYAHVQNELREAAIDAGATQVMSRSAFVEKVDEVLRAGCVG